MKVAYDKLNDVVSIYYEVQETNSGVTYNKSNSKSKSDRNYEVDEAANLILDTVDLFDNKGNCTGFRVFNATKHYDNELLEAADPEEIPKSELLKIPNEKVIAKYSMDKNKIYEQQC